MALSALRSRLGSYIDPIAPRPLGRWGWIVVGLVVLLLGLPSLLAPFDIDTALFYISGQRILRGAVHYRDIVDLKPPLIYHLYAAALGLFGETRFGFRLFDLLWQCGTVLFLVALVRRVVRCDLWAALAGLAYALLLFSHPGYMGQAESFAGLPMVGLFWLLTRPAPKGDGAVQGVWIGLVLGALMHLKPTFGVLLLVVAAADAMLYRRSNLLRRWLLMFLALGAVLSLLPLSLLLTGSGHDYALMQGFLAGYVAIQWGHPTALAKEMLRTVPLYFTNTYSVLLVLLTLVGIVRVVPARGEGNAVEPSSALLRVAALAWLLLLLSVLVEAKLLSWHFSRLFVPGAILASWGLIALIRWAVTSRFDWYGRLLLLPLAAAALLFSPLTRFAWHTASTLAAAVRGAEAFDEMNEGTGSLYALGEIQKVGEYIRGHRGSGDHLFVASAAASLFHYYADDVPEFKLYHSSFLVAPFAPEEWRQQTASYLLTRQPRFIVMQRDAVPSTTGTERTSEQGVTELPGVADLLRARYRVGLNSPIATVYERVGGGN